MGWFIYFSIYLSRMNMSSVEVGISLFFYLLGLFPFMPRGAMTP